MRIFSDIRRDITAESQCLALSPGNSKDASLLSAFPPQLPPS